MQVYQTRYSILPGSSYDEVIKAARYEHRTIQRHTKRQPYVRSSYFNKDKIFLNIFWDHLMQKHRSEQVRRARYYACAIDLLRNTTYDPTTIFSQTSLGILLHRFEGRTKAGEIFCVQVKQNKKTGRKDFMSVFPVKK